jgi:hypothetical protein
VPAPRELSPAERAAVELATAYFERGPEAWWERLADGAPLKRLGREAALREIEARVGPADGAAWQLHTPVRADPQAAVLGVEFASGLDETLTLRLVDEGGWKLAELRTSVDPAAVAPLPPASAAVEAPPPPAPEAGTYRLRLALGLAVLAIALGAGGGLLLARAGRSRAALGAMAAAGAAVLGALLWGGSSGPTPAFSQAREKPRPAGDGRLGSLVSLRAALAAGIDRGEIERRLASVPDDPKLREVHALWRAQYLLDEADLTGADTILRGFPKRTAYPLADLLRARLAFRRMQREETGWQYEQAIRGGLDHDGLLLEALFAKAQTDEGDRAEVELARLIEMGSRLAEPWYMSAQLAATRSRLEDSEALLRRAWQLEPMPRAELFDNPLLTHLAALPALFPLFQLGVPEEPRLPAQGSRSPLAVPAGARISTCGQSLRLVLGNAELLVPGGALLAPPEAVLEDAETWRHHAEAKALAALPSLTRATAAGETLPPRLLRLAERAAGALAEQNRWNELIALTEPFAAKAETAPANLVRLRARALHQLERDGEARQLLVGLAKSDMAGRRPAAGTLFDLAELLAAAGELDTAIKLLEKADAQLPEPRSEQRRRQFAMDRDLAASFASYRSEHFEVRYPPATGEAYAKKVVWMLEQERTRLQRWIPPAGSERIEVHLFPAKEFFTNFSGDIGVIGLFDGKVRVPFAEIRSLHPQLVAVLSHEVAHALIAAATKGQAPHWLQEGLAQHVEMGTRRVNPLPDLARTGRALSFPLVDPILSGFAEERFVGLAYEEAAWTVAFLEARFGEEGIRRLIKAFAAGKTTEQALKEVCGLTPAELDRAFWAWGTTGQKPTVRRLETRRYDVEAAAKEQKAQEDSIPTLSVNTELRDKKRADEAARVQAETEERRRLMAAWHVGYAARTAGVKRALKPVLQAYGTGGAGGGDTAASCRGLSVEVSRALNDPEPWVSVEPETNRALREAYNLLGSLARACQAGSDTEARLLLGKVNAALDKAARLLAPYELRP